MNLLRRGRAENPASDTPEPTPTVDDTRGGATTAGKGKPTPKRRDAQGGRRGPVVPAPQTAKEARAFRRARRGTKVDRKQSAAQRREASALRRERMAAGDENYLPPRDKGPVKAFVRDFVDSRRSVVGMFMPMAVVLLVVLYGGMFVAPALQVYVTLFMVVMLVLMIIDGLVMGRRVTKRVRERFPNATERPFTLGWYAFTRASQLRMLRLPKPKVAVGDTI